MPSHGLLARGRPVWGSQNDCGHPLTSAFRAPEHLGRPFHIEMALRVLLDGVSKTVGSSPPVDQANAIRGLVTHEWLEARSGEARNDVFCSPEAKQLLKKRLSDPEDARRALDQYFSVRWTDDDPLMSIDVIFHDGRRIHLESSQQPALMLPWKVGEAETWNPEIPRAIIGLLPTNSEPRLSDRHLAYAYLEEVLSDVRHELEDPEERCVHHNFLQAVEKRFEVVRMYHGSSGWFTAYVRRADFPANLVLTLVIRNDDKPDARAKLDLSVQRSWVYVNRARDYVGKHPERHFAIWCADGISVEGNDRAIRISDYDTKS